MKIVILDAQALRAGDLDWTSLYAITDDITLYENTQSADLASRIGNAEAVILNKGCINDEVLSHCPNLKYVGITATGYDTLDVAACTARGVTVTNVPGYGTESVAQHLFALLLEYAAGTSSYAKAATDGDWLPNIRNINNIRPTVELFSKTIGIIGFGNIGSAAARIAIGFGMNVLCYTKSLKPQTQGAEFCTLDELLRRSDIVSLHCPHTEKTDKMIDTAAIELMKPGAVLCNLSRGKLIDDEAVATALQSGRLGFFVGDVLTGEPQTATNPLLHCKNTLITPHVAWATTDALYRLSRTVCDNLIAFFNSKPQNVVQD